MNHEKHLAPGAIVILHDDISEPRRGICHHSAIGDPKQARKPYETKRRVGENSAERQKYVKLQKT
jgi:hypothetical protein